MSSRPPRGPQTRPPAVPIHRGPQAMPPAAHLAAAGLHAPNAALLIDFDNVTMGIQKDLHAELKNLLSSDIIKGKVAVQRAYADWRRYTQYVVPLTEASIDLVWAVAYGSTKKNATDIRLAVDAMELVFARPEIGTFILLSGDSDFSSLVIKLKEYGKYVIGVGIRESSSDLLVMNCDEYYSYNALAGLVKMGDEELVARDPWELVVEATQRMKRNGDVMRADRLKQVMQDIDPSFDEKNLGMAKFSRFVTEAAERGLVKLTKLDNGQYEVGLVDGSTVAGDGREAPRGQPAGDARFVRDREAPREPAREGPRDEAAPAAGPDRDRDRGRGRGRDRGRGRGWDRGRDREGRPTDGGVADVRGPESRPADARPGESRGPIEEMPREAPAPAPAGLAAELTGELLTREEAMDLVRRAVAELTRGSDDAVRASDVRVKAHELLGRDSKSLGERLFHRILRDAHDADVVDLRKRGDDYEVAPAVVAEPIAAQLGQGTGGASGSSGGVAAPAAPEAPSFSASGVSQASRSAANANSLRRGIRHRTAGGAGRGRGAEIPPELLSLGMVEEPVEAAPATPASTDMPESAGAPAESIVPAAEPEQDEPAAKKRGRRGGRGGRGGAGGAREGAEPAEPAGRQAPEPEPEAEPAAAEPAAATRKGRKTAPAARGARKRAAAPEAAPEPEEEAAPAGAGRAGRRGAARKRPRAGGAK